MNKRFILGLGLLVLSIGVVHADEQIPDAIKAKMDGYVGVWEFSEEFFGTPDSEPVEVSGEFSARWIFDHLIEWRGTFITADSTVTTVEYESYDKQNNGYGYWFASDGYRGNYYDRVWDANTTSSQDKTFAPDGTVTRGRCNWSYNKDFTRMEYTCESLTNGVWRIARRGSAKKK